MSGDAQLLVSDRPVSPQTSSPAPKLPAAATLTQREPCVGQEANYRQPSSVPSSQSGSQGPTTPGTSDTEWGTRPPPQGAPSQLVDQTSAMAAVVVSSMAAAAVGLGTGTKSGDSPRVASGQAGQAPTGQRSQGSNSDSVTRSVSLTGAINGLYGTVPDEKQKETIDESECPVVELRRHPARAHLRHAHSEAETTDLQISRRRSQTMAEMKEHAYHRLQEELQKAQTDLRLRDEECEKLSKVRDQMEEELDDLTASLFEEANKMVQEANVKRMHTEKLLAESNQKIEVLQAEVVALKQLVLTSTPSSPNKHLHPQIAEAKEKKVSKPFWKTHRRSTSHHEFTKESRQAAEAQQNHSAIHCKDFDTACYDQFLGWRQDPVMECTSPFLARMMMEDIIPCLNFSNKKLAERVQHCVEHNTLTIEPIPGDNSYPRKCSLTETNKLCNYKIKLEEDQEWYSISQMCRNRIASVCDFYTYIRYIHQGLVRQEVLAQDKVSLGCFGSAGSCLNHNLTCPDTARVAIQEALYGHKTWVNCTTGVISCSDTCCSYLRNSDCFHTFIAGDIGDIYRNCSSHFCDFRTPRLTEPCTGFQAISSYSVVEYECVEESSIIPMCGAAKYTVGQSVSILYDPTQQYMDPTDVCYCTMYQPTRSQVVIEGIDIRLAGPNGGCGTLGIHNSTSAFPQRNCSSPSTWPSLSLAQTSDRYFYLTLTNRAEFVWIRFKATNSLTVACSLNAVHTTTPAPTTTTSTTTSTTTTTVTYPTAPPPTTRPPPTRSSSSTPQTSTTSTITSTTTSTTTKAPTATPTPTPTTTLVSPMTTTAVLPTTTTSSASSTSPGTTTDSNSRSTERQATSTGPADNVGTIIGAVVGGVAFLIVVIVVITWCRKKHKTAKQSDTSGRQSAIYDNIVTSGVPNSNHVYETIKPPESKAVGPPQPVSQPQPVGPAQTVGPPQPVEASQKKEAAELNSKLTNNNNTKSNEHTYITIIPSEAVKENNIISIRL